MLDLFAIISKGGIVLWCFQGTCQVLAEPINSLIKSVILQGLADTSYNHENLSLKFKLDNEFELVFVVGYQKTLQLSYVDKFLSDIQLEFRDKFKSQLQQGRLCHTYDFQDDYHRILKTNEEWGRREAQTPLKMRTFEQSKKSQKTVASLMIDTKKKNDTNSKEKVKGNVQKKNQEKMSPQQKETIIPQTGSESMTRSSDVNGNKDEVSEADMMKNRIKMFNKANKVKKEPKPVTKVNVTQQKEKKKMARQWDFGGTNKDMKSLDFSNVSADNNTVNGSAVEENAKEFDTSVSQNWVGSMKGELKSIDYETDSSEDEIDVDNVPTKPESKKTSRGFGMFSLFKGLVGSKTLTREDMTSALEKMKDHLITKNVAAEIADKLCESVAAKLEGKVLGTFSGVASTVKNSVDESLVQILSPHRRVDILRDALEAKKNNRPFSITFCGVNGVGKSTNLAKICFWLIENGLRVLIAACDTFRAGAVEQLRTHTRHLNALHPPKRHGGSTMIDLYERGYGKDAAGIAMEAINFAREHKFDVVLIDTAGRMQDNEPLMRALAKLIKVNLPDLVLFVGEALVGNEAVDQLVKFNQALADHSLMNAPRQIDGILLTKFDTIDDKVGAAISMTYITGKPIVFVGTGQTYTDLKNLNVKAAVHSLLKP